RVLAFPGSRLALPPAAQIGGRTRVLTFRTADGLTLRAARVSSGAPRAPVAVYFHGNAEAAVQNLPLAAALADGGVDVVLAEYRGYGGQPGRPDEEGLSADGAALLAALAAEGVTPDRLVLVGRSLGTGVAVELALRTPPALLVLVSPYTSFPDLGRTLVGPLAPLVVPDRFDNLGKIGRLSCPVVILHGTRDEVVPFRMGEVLARAGRNVRFLALEGRTHNDIPDLPALLLAEIRRGTGD
ncbi:MAG TPA: alpha/beta hydrolase, partial [Thermoanaerobaculia bacterium]|nr:alpha/beta hydrolase [Thermoanaerobaculia bacterium]